MEDNALMDQIYTRTNNTSMECLYDNYTNTQQQNNPENTASPT